MHFLFNYFRMKIKVLAIIKILVRYYYFLGCFYLYLKNSYITVSKIDIYSNFELFFTTKVALPVCLLFILICINVLFFQLTLGKV